MRRNRGHQNAAASGKSASGAKCRSPISFIAATGSSGIVVGDRSWRTRRCVSWIRVPRSAAPGRRVDVVERRKLEHVLGVDRVRVAQPVLDLGDAELARAAPRAAAWARAARPGLPCAARRACGPSAAYRAPRSSAASQRASPATAASRCTNREATVGAPPAWPRAAGSPRGRRAPGRSRAPTGRCAAPAGRGRARGASGG